MPEMDDALATRIVGGRALCVRRVRLEVVAGPDRGLARDLAAERFTIGAAPGNDLVLSDGAISRHHVEVTATAAGHLLRDLDSTNGTWIDGLRVREAYLAPGARIALGESAVRFDALADEEELELAGSERCHGLVGRSPAMRRLFAQLDKLAPREATVLIAGESGTGKELVARALHAGGRRAGGPLVVVDCGAMPATLMESLLFGHERGAFTGAVATRAGAFERADGGTLFLDEIGELPLDLQPKFLRALEQREVERLGGSGPRRVDVRVVAATNRDLRAEVNRGTFRADLFYRLSVVELRLPPLRERPDDVPLLVRHFLDELSRRDGVEYRIGPRALERLQRHRWPGNVRELRNFVERSVSLAEGRDLDPVALGATLHGLAPGGAATPEGSPSTAPRSGEASLPSSEGSIEFSANPSPRLPRDLLLLPFKVAKRLWVEPWEREYLAALLARTGGNVSKAAREADMDRAHLIDLLKKHDLK